MAREMHFETRHDRISRDLAQVEEFRQILTLDNSFPSQDFIDMTDALEGLRVAGTAMETVDLFDLKCSMHTIAECVKFFVRDEASAKYPQLHELSTHIDYDPALLRMLDKTIDDKGAIYDDASDALLDIRRQMARKRGEVDSQLNRSLAHAKREGWAPENAEITIRNGRMVIPMLDTHRRKIRGLIHDESATRQTAYLEPSEVVELNNDLRELEFAERHEIVKIILHICDRLRLRLDTLINNYWVLARYDFVRAKAAFALDADAMVPRLSERPCMDWLGARHPLLYLQRKESAVGDVVPFDLQMSDTNRILIISGPNAGGKSVCLKAIGLLQYMLQCGLPVTCKDTSEFGLFDRIFIDIGDEQSIESDLSTYTSHLQNLKALYEVADSRTLFLLDELGGGTEPRSGCAIAEALLEELCQRRALGVVTTHFADLQLLPDRHEGDALGGRCEDPGAD